MQERRVLVGDLPIHFRIGGSGPPLLMLHPSPSSSKALIPIANHLLEHFTVIAMDTPGYGDSPSFVDKTYEMSSYATWIHHFLNELDIDKIAIYGSATGGQLAVRFGLMYPDLVEHLFLDNCAHFPEELRTNIIDNYFPDLKPQLSGSHINQIWDIATYLFKYFPWCCQSDEYKVNMPTLPAAVYHTVAMEYLVAGEHYYRAYRSAFHHERVEYIQELKVPATILRWQGSIVKKYTDRLFDFELPKQIDQAVIPAPAADRYQGIKKTIIEKYKSSNTFNTKIGDALYNQYNNAQNKRIQAFSMMPDAPDFNMNGSHLTEAWDILKQNNPKDDAESLQQKLIDWYAYKSSLEG